MRFVARLYAPGVCIGFAAGALFDRLVVARHDAVAIPAALIVGLGAAIWMLAERPRP